MRKLSFLFLILDVALLLAACSDSETYAEQKKKERKAISSYIRDKGIKVISEATFKAAGETTDTAKNEFVLFESSGVYMQIVRKGCGKKIADGETATVLCRFSEYNLLANPDTVQLTNNVLRFAFFDDKMTVINNSGTFQGSFIPGFSVMHTAYRSTAVPTGWLATFSYVNIGRPSKADEELAKVKLIVPHDKGTTVATRRVYPTLYVLTFQRGL